MTDQNSQASGLRTAVVGLGRMGIRHVQALQKLGMNICGVADSSADALMSAQSAYGIAPQSCFNDANDMIARVGPEALVVATTAPTHARFVQAAAEAGVRYVLCEKPLATSLAEAEVMLQSCARAGTRLAVNHQMRYMPQYTRVKALIDSAALGPLASVLVAGSNFGLAMNASHYFEMFRYVSGEPVLEIQAWLEEEQLANPRGPQFEDRSGRLLARAASGRTMYVDFSANAGWGLQVIYICKHGQIFVDELNGEMIVKSRQTEFRALPTTRYGMPVDITRVQIEPADTVAPTIAVWNALLADDGYPDGQTGTHALACLVAAHASHAVGGRPVRLEGLDDWRGTDFKWA